MRVLLDESLPRRLKFELEEHEVSTVPEMGWSGTKNGQLLRLAEQDFEVFITMDRHLQDQQNLAGLRLGVVVLRAKTNVLSDLLPLVGLLRDAIAEVRHGTVAVVAV